MLMLDVLPDKSLFHPPANSISLSYSCGRRELRFTQGFPYYNQGSQTYIPFTNSETMVATI